MRKFTSAVTLCPQKEQSQARDPYHAIPDEQQYQGGKRVFLASSLTMVASQYSNYDSLLKHVPSRSKNKIAAELETRYIAMSSFEVLASPFVLTTFFTSAIMVIGGLRLISWVEDLDPREPPSIRPRVPFIGHSIGYWQNETDYHWMLWYSPLVPC